MTYRDEMLECKECGAEFVYRVEEQRLQEEMGFEPEIPENCPNCRAEASAGPGLRPGIIKWYSDEKHFGFLTQSDGSEVFFHQSGVEGDASALKEGTQVWYELTMTDRGPQAVNVHLRA